MFLNLYPTNFWAKLICLSVSSSPVQIYNTYNYISQILNAIPLEMMSLSAVIRICLPNFTQGISFVVSRADGPVDKSIAWLSLKRSFFLTGSTVASCDNSNLDTSFRCSIVFASFKSMGGADCTIFLILAINSVSSLWNTSWNGICKPPCGRSEEYWWWLSIILQTTDPLLCMKREHAVDIFCRTCPITSLPLLMATA